MENGLITLDTALVSVERCGLVVPDEITKDEWDDIGRAIGQVVERSQWYIGDWILAGERKWGEIYDEAEKLTGLGYQTLADAKRICEQYEFPRRRGNLSFSHHRDVAGRENRDELLDWAEETGASRSQLREKAGLKSSCHVSHNSGDNEWYTPAEFIEAAREVMGEIDLDPATSDVAQKTVQANMYFTKEDDGLDKTWNGRVWMNPPYAQPLCQNFCQKLAEEYDVGHVTEAVVLVNNATDTKWFRSLADVMSAVCFPTGRIKFEKDDGGVGAPLQGQAILYFGANYVEFSERFGEFGFILFAKE